MISRRGFFGMLAGLAVCPLFGRKLPAQTFRYKPHYENFVQDDLISSGNMTAEELMDLLEKYTNYRRPA